VESSSGIRGSFAESPLFKREASFSSKQAYKVLNPLLDDEDGVWLKAAQKTKAKADLQQAASRLRQTLTFKRLWDEEKRLNNNFDRVLSTLPRFSRTVNSNGLVSNWY
jgi:hypothetical protein